MRNNLRRERLKEFEPIFFPRSIAVVGASTDLRNVGSQWVQGLLTAGFRGELYPVNPRGGELLGLKIYPSLRAIPGAVDFVVVCTPRASVLDVLDDCIVKGVKTVQLFTAGFRETGVAEWIEVEEKMVRLAHQGAFRIIGPNCIGIYCPEHRVPYGPSSLLGEAGSVGFISQSGGHLAKILEIGLTRGIGFSKAVSLGNSSDLDIPDFLEYMALDSKTNIIGVYLEGTRDGRRLFQTIQAVSRIKPVVVWKGGRTQAGARAAASHTGAMVSSASVWSAALKQAGAIDVPSLEELADTLLLFEKVGRIKVNNLGIICGLSDGGGGESVLAADSCAAHGLNVPPFTGKTQEKLTKLLGQVGSVLCNPLDVSQSYGNPQIVEQSMELVAAERYIDLIVVYENVDILLRYLSKEIADALNNVFIKFGNERSKPIVVVLPPGSAEVERLEVERRLSQAEIPVYPTIDRAAKAINNMNQYHP